MPIILAFDIGLVHTGVAISYENKVAEGLTTIHARNHDLLQQEIMELIKRYQPSAIVFGIPQKGPLNEHVLLLKNKLETILSLPIVLVNEDLSTRLATRAMIDANRGPRYRMLNNHQVAAASILQLYLDNLIE